MTKEEKKEKELIVRMMCATARANGKDASLEHITQVAERLHRLESILNRLAIDQCNKPVYDAAGQKHYEEVAEKVISENLGCRCYTQRDPRGFSIRMYLVDEEDRKWSNTWDGETTGLAW